MKAGTHRAFPLSALCVLLLLSLGACTFFSTDGNQNAPPGPGAANKDLTEAEAREALNRTQTELARAQERAKGIDKARAEASAARQAANTLKTKADRMRRQTEAAAKNPDDQQESPLTYAATQEWKQADSKAIAAAQFLEELEHGVGQAEAKVEAARQALAEAQRRAQAQVSPTSAAPADAPPAPTTDAPLRLTLLPLTIALLLLLEGAAGLFLLKRMTNRVEVVERTLGSAEKRLELLAEKPGGGDGAPGALGVSLPKIVTALDNLQHTASGLGRALEEHAQFVKSVGRSLPSPPREQTPAPAPSAAPQAARLEFPLSAEDFLSRVGSDFVPVSHDYLKNLLVRNDDEGTMLLVEDGAPANMNFVVPKLKRFQTRADFDTHYSDYFDCPNPSSGDITIIKPAVVYRASGGWQLHQRGELKV